jgi:hypothetical protein
MTRWEIKGQGFTNCNCAYGCPCQFNALPTHGNCQAVVGYQIDEGYHGDVRLDGLKIAMVARWPGPIHEGKGETIAVIDERATPEQRTALLRILGGKDTAPGATVWQVFSTTFEVIHDPVFAPIEFTVDVEKRLAKLVVPDLIDGRGEPIKNPVTGAEHRARIDIPHGFEYTIAEIGAGWSKTTGPIRLDLANTYGQFNKLHLNQNGVVH